MKTMVEILALPRTLFLETGEDGFAARVTLLSSKKSEPAVVVGSWGAGWDHVSVSFRKRTPTWEEMAEVKRMFFYPEEVCVEYHPPESEYVNLYPYCLHLWRFQQPGMPMPPRWMVGPRQGESVAEALRRAEADIARFEAGGGV